MSRKETWDWKIANKKKGGWNVDKVSAPFFLTNFPPDLDNKQLWSIFEKYGRVLDVYIARKLSKFGKRHHVFVSLAKFGRENTHVHGESQVHVHTIGGGNNNSHKVTYANAVKGVILKANKAKLSLTLEGKDLVNDLALKPSVFCQVRSVRLIQKLLVLLKVEGLWLMGLKYWRGLFGLKFYDGAVNKVAGIWGEVCFLDDDNQAPLAIKRVCNKTTKPSLIHDKLSLVVQRILYNVVVREFSNWEPDILCNEEALDCDLPSLSGDSEKGVNGFDDIVAEEEGEVTPKGKVKYIDMENDNSFGIEQDYVSNRGQVLWTGKADFFK
ncbi:unnamed protein product [Lactuca virosa]|uniref:RRM domain-containing protein n=1 Tax=Lactuca virosa TaxID=75947 RepID=A0AAU9MRG6_9ASTR|nr:unnamed protein product [Lactuca virosa]